MTGKRNEMIDVLHHKIPAEVIEFADKLIVMRTNYACQSGKLKSI